MGAGQSSTTDHDAIHNQTQALSVFS